jgi:hypothetical protein
MIQSEIFIATTWNASTSFIPFKSGMQNAQDYKYQGINNRGIFATTAHITGVWENKIYEDGFKEYLGRIRLLQAHRSKYNNELDMLQGLNGPYAGTGNAFSPGTTITVKIRKLKALKTNPNRSGIQINRQLLKGNKLTFRYVAQGELVRP